jgi:hypothetical protein
MWLFFQSPDERAPPWQSYVKVVDPEEQEEAVARLGVVCTRQRGMLVGAPLVEAQRDEEILGLTSAQATREARVVVVERVRDDEMWPAAILGPIG